MRLPAKPLFAACLAMIVAEAGIQVSTAADNGAAAQDLLKVRDSGVISAALWMRQPDSYDLHVVLDRPAYDAKRKAVVEANREQVANPEQVIANQARVVSLAQAIPDDRGSYFIGNTIANLRGLEAWPPCGRTLTMMDGRRPGVAQQPPRVEPIPLAVPFAPPKAIQAWLLKADGTQILPATYSCNSDSSAVDVSYGFSIAEGQQAVAAAVRIVDGYYIEKLQPLEPPAATTR